jgi:hypothetical protein
VAHLAGTKQFASLRRVWQRESSWWRLMCCWVGPSRTLCDVLSRVCSLVAVCLLMASCTGASHSTSKSVVTASTVVPPSDAATSTTPAPVTTPVPPAASPVSFDPAYLRLVSPGHAWIATSDPHIKVFRTSDGGRAWSDVTPPIRGLANVDNTITGFTANDDAHAVVAVPRAANSKRVTLYATADGGASWAATTIAGYDYQDFSFLDALHGWDESSRGAESGA